MKDTLGEDWSLLAAGGGSYLAFSGIVADPGQQTIFAGGPKDIQDLGSWSWKGNGGFPDKNDITNAFAAAYMNDSDLIVYFGADRYANAGDAYLGFWFFKDRISLTASGKFTGQHQLGDLLVLVNYLQGSSAPEIQVLEWNPAAADVAQNLHLMYSGPGALCGALTPATACAVTNSFEQPAPWPYVPKSGTSGIYPPESFFEGGVNLTALLGASTCFSSFMAETRSSTSVTAALKDFVLGEFPVCGISVSKVCSVVDFVPGLNTFLIDFTATVTNTGAGVLPVGSLVEVVDDAGSPGDATDDVVLVEILQAPIGPGEGISLNGSFASPQNPPVNTVTATVTTADAVLQASAFSVECNGMLLSPDLALSKTCSVVLEASAGLVVVRVDFVGSVQNTGNIPLSVSVTDDKAGLVLPTQLIQPGQVVPLSGSYYPAGINGQTIDPTTAGFGGTLTATGTSPFLPGPVMTMSSANCTLCR